MNASMCDCGQGDWLKEDDFVLFLNFFFKSLSRFQASLRALVFDNDCASSIESFPFVLSEH